VEDFPAVESCVEHTDAHRDLREILALELADEIVGVRHIARNDFGVTAFVFGMQFVQVIGEPGCVVLGDREDDSLA
jgi:hypothetical protein